MERAGWELIGLLKGIGIRVRMARADKHMSQAQLAECLHVSTPYVSNIEQGKQAMSVVTLNGICETLEVSADWLLLNRSPGSQRVLDEEIARLLEDCTPVEKKALLQILTSAKEAFRSIENDG